MTKPKDGNFSEISAYTDGNRQVAAPSGENKSASGATIGAQLTQQRSTDVLPGYPVLSCGWTYFVQRGDGQVKIGHSGKPRHRINSLTAEHGPLKVLAVVPGAVAGEFETHQKFGHLRAEGEWFAPAADLLRFIEEVKAAPMPAIEPPPRPAFQPDYDFTRSRAKLNPAKTLSKMLKMRSTIGADTPTGHRISNIDEIRQNRIAAEADGDLVRVDHLDASLARQLRDLEMIRARHTH